MVLSSVSCGFEIPRPFPNKTTAWDKTTAYVMFILLHNLNNIHCFLMLFIIYVYIIIHMYVDLVRPARTLPLMWTWYIIPSHLVLGKYIGYEGSCTEGCLCDHTYMLIVWFTLWRLHCAPPLCFMLWSLFKSQSVPLTVLGPCRCACWVSHSDWKY